MAGFKSNVLDRFPAGTKLSVHPRLADSFGSALPTLKTVSVPADGEVSVSGLDEGAPYWLSDGDRAVAFIAKDAQGKVQSPAAKLAAKHGGLASPAPGRSVTSNVITGARSSSDIKRRHQEVVLSEDRDRAAEEPVPAPNQLDVKGTPQRSDTAFGEATPKDPKEDVPRPAQDTVGKRQPQRSSTEFGEATPKPKDEVEPALAQEDAGRLKQRSDTELGSVEPKPRGKSKTAAKKRKDSSAAKAEGATPAKPSEKTSKSARSKK